LRKRGLRLKAEGRKEAKGRRLQAERKKERAEWGKGKGDKVRRGGDGVAGSRAQSGIGIETGCRLSVGCSLFRLPAVSKV
jgi:hypothetical protein